MDLASLLASAKQAFLVLPPVVRSTIWAGVTALLFGLIIYAVERRHGRVTEAYQRRAFLHDLGYWFYYKSGVHYTVLTFGALSLIAPYLAFADYQLFSLMPAWMAFPLSWVITDFVGYWVHRAQHGFSFWWCFHAVHHSQEHLSFATSNRSHPIDQFFSDLVSWLPVFALGAPPEAWLPVALARQFHDAVNHAGLRWTYGPLYRVWVSPAFHGYHHSSRPEHYDRNFAGLFAFWDYLFGTAAEPDGRPVSYGVPGLQVETFADQLLLPFRLLRDRLARRRKVPVS